MILYHTNEITFAEGEFYTIQSMAGLPSPPPGRTLVGQGYNLVATGFPTETEVLTGSISFQYLGNDVLMAGADEEDLTIYFWNSHKWTELPTVLNTYFNMASAPSQGPGIYALMTSVRIRLYGPGWNNFAYSVRETQSVTEALLSISGYYTTVYGYEPEDPDDDPWKVYDVTVPDWVNDLKALEFSHGYWINVSRSITLHLGSGVGASQQSLINNLQFMMPLPPSTFYGPVLGGSDFTPAAGVKMTAWIDGRVCGQARMKKIDGRVVYAVDVLAETIASAPGCGAPGKRVTFRAGEQTLAPSAVWDNNRLWELALRRGCRAYLPLVLRND
jgi:hypothetical protein